jgi:hypothetical protein
VGDQVRGVGLADLAQVGLESAPAKARAAGATVLYGPVTVADRDSAVVRFPGGYVAEIYDITKH